MKCELAPSVLSCDWLGLREAVRELADSGADWIHFDVMDGQFVPPITFGDALIKTLRDEVATPFEAHLMTLTPEAHFEAFAQAGCQRIIFQAEATHHAHRAAQRLDQLGVKPAVAINPGTPLEALVPLLGSIDLALIMTVNPGWGGQELILKCLEKVRLLRNLDPHLNIEVDGGMTPEHIELARAEGANVFVAGSYLTKRPSIRQAMQELRSACG